MDIYSNPHPRLGAHVATKHNPQQKIARHVDLVMVNEYGSAATFLSVVTIVVVSSVADAACTVKPYVACSWCSRPS